MDLEGYNLLATAIKYVGVGLCMIPFTGVAIGTANLFATFMSEFSRNPAAKGQLFTYTLIGFALTEAAGLYALVIAFIIMFS